MYKRLLTILFFIFVLLVSACAKPPVEQLVAARELVAHAYASGASQLAPVAYQYASEALHEAEEHLKHKRYDDAEISLALAKNYSQKAVAQTLKAKQKREEEKKAAEQKRLAEEQARVEELNKLREEQLRKKAEEKKLNPIVVKKKVPEQPKLAAKVVVLAGENLQDIAARSEVYDDGFLWPLIYKANRDQIKNPKEIFPGQEFLVPRDKSLEEISAARKEAKELNLF